VFFNYGFYKLKVKRNKREKIKILTELKLKNTSLQWLKMKKKTNRKKNTNLSELKMNNFFKNQN